MKVSLNWLKEFVEIPVEPRRLKADLISVGLNVESFAAAGDDSIFEIEVTTNRPDCLSHYGVAREVATLYRKRLKRPEYALREASTPASGEASVEILNPELCARYCGRVMQGVKVQPSPEWLQRRLEAVGQRPINNVADITNYVLMELGHPLHAFDLARLTERKIVVRRAQAGEHLRTLDGVDRTLGSDDLVIADAVRPVALAGVMGGADSQISSGTQAVLLESAWFEPVSIRRTSKSQGMHTEASHRFERGADIEMAPVALDRAAGLIAQLAGGEILRGVLDVHPAPRPPRPMMLRRSEVQRVLGTEISWEEIERFLRGLGFEVERRGTDAWRITPPSFRLDVAGEIDLIEEVARHYGYNRLPSRVRPAPPRITGRLEWESEVKVSDILVGIGYREIIPSAMVDPEENARFTSLPPVILANPLSQDASAMRSSAIPSLVRALRWNLDRYQNDLRLAETGRIYISRPQGLPEEKRVLTLGASGQRRPESVHDGERRLDFFDLKGDVEELLGAFDLPGLTFEPSGGCYHEPGQGGRFVVDGMPLALLGRLKESLAREYKLRQEVWVAEIDLDLLLKAPLRHPSFRPVSKFPPVERDFSLIVPETAVYRRLEEAVRGLGLEETQSIVPMDRRRSEELAAGKIPRGHVSLLLRITFQSPTHTLSSEEIEAASRRVVEALEPLGIRIRT